MSWLWATRRLDRELEAAGVRGDRREGLRDGI
jgi:hypothetical protein